MKHSTKKKFRIPRKEKKRRRKWFNRVCGGFPLYVVDDTVIGVSCYDITPIDVEIDIYI